MGSLENCVLSYILWIYLYIVVGGFYSTAYSSYTNKANKLLIPMIKKNSNTSPMGSTIKSFMYAINKLNLFI